MKPNFSPGAGNTGLQMDQNLRILRFCFLVIFCLLAAFISKVEAEEKLLYAIRYESLQRYPDIVITKIYSLDPVGGESHLIFSDENSTILLLPRRGMPGHPGEVLVSSKNRVFAHAVEKRLRPGRWYPHKASVYELSVDGSHQARKIFDVIGEQSLAEIFVDSSGTKIGYINFLDKETFVFIHHAQTGKLLHKINANGIFLDCFVSTIGWLPNEKRLYFTLDTGDVHVTSNDSYKKRGAYIINEDGTGLTKLPDKLVLFPLEKDFWRATESPPQFIGGSPDGTYIFRDVHSNRSYGGIQTTSLLYKVNPETHFQMRIPLKISAGLNWFKLSPTVRHIAFTEKVYSGDGSFKWIEHLWIKDVSSGEEKILFSLDNRPFKGRYLGLVGWLNN